MKKIIHLTESELRTYINETLLTETMNLQKLERTMDQHDCAFISAFRIQLRDIPKQGIDQYPDVYMGEHNPSTYGGVLGREKAEKLGLNPSQKVRGVFGMEHTKQIGTPYSKKENRRRNVMLKGELLRLGYGVTAVHGIYPERATRGDGKKFLEESGEDSLCVVNKEDDPMFKNNLISLGKRYNQDSILYIPKGKDGFLIGTNSQDKYSPHYLEQGDSLKFKPNMGSNMMTRIGNKSMAMVNPKDSEYFENPKDAYDSIDRHEEPSQKYFPPDKTSFGIRKQQRINAAQKKNESLSRVYKLVRECINDVLNEATDNLEPKFLGRYGSNSLGDESNVRGLSDVKEALDDITQTLDSYFHFKKRYGYLGDWEYLQNIMDDESDMLYNRICIDIPHQILFKNKDRVDNNDYKVIKKFVTLCQSTYIHAEPYGSGWAGKLKAIRSFYKKMYTIYKDFYNYFLDKHYDNDAIKTNDNNQSWNEFDKMVDNNKKINNKSKVDLDIDYILRNRNQFKENPSSIRRKMNYSYEHPEDEGKQVMFL